MASVAGQILWGQVAKLYNHAATLGTVFALIAALSSAIKRVFSRARRIDTPDRNRLSCITMDALMLACSNEDLFAKIIQ